MSYPQANQELTVGAMKEMTEHIEKQDRFPFHKKMSSLDGALRYARLALETYCNAKTTIEPIDEPIWKFLITVSCVEFPPNVHFNDAYLNGTNKIEKIILGHIDKELRRLEKKNG